MTMPAIAPPEVPEVGPSAGIAEVECEGSDVDVAFCLGVPLEDADVAPGRPVTPSSCRAGALSSPSSAETALPNLGASTPSKPSMVKRSEKLMT